ncbi:MAG: cation:proton antiporter [Desulfuromonadaceae bacterium]|nr:cation:proton antiporter [Desulfuromonadaceae bacterium]
MMLQLLTGLATVFLGALIGGRLASMCYVPRVTGYLLVGLLIGPSMSGLLGLPSLLTGAALEEMRIIADVALALILMNIGGSFELENLRRWGRRLLIFSATEILVTFFSVALATGLLNQFYLHHIISGLSLWETSLFSAIFLGIIASATAPAVTMMVVREYEAEGPVTSTILTLIGLNNLVAVLSFVIVTYSLLRPEEGVAVLLLKTCGPLLIGSVFGFFLAAWAQRLELPSEHKTLLLGGVISCTALCRYLQVDFLLANLMLGMVLANSSPRWHRLQESLRHIDYPLYVVFFVFAGATLHIETLSQIGLIGVAYVLARTLGKWLGSRCGAQLGGFGKRERAYAGITMLAQGGVAIGLAGQIAYQWPTGGHLIETIVLGAVVIFELIGPLAIRHGLVQAGEVPLLSLLQKRAPLRTMEGLHNVAQHFRAALGLPGHNFSDPGDIHVRHIMRQNIETVRNDTPYYDLLKFISHSRYDRFPVVDAEQRFLGMINYTEIRDLLFEPTLAPLVVAGDLTAANPHAINPEQSLREALKVLQLNRNISYFPVVSKDEPDRLLGILSQNDVLAAFRRLKADP